ncbi:MAG: TetR/AcrR family transcriptional regulator [Gammaproteobacteria bacterium]|nr:TetR/AcrR family transcriptional regulator [Gammaproteobacteria bacterium]
MSPAPKYTHDEQEKLILNAAAECIESCSLIDFKMSDISKGAGISMGSVYKHIQSKEDVLIALTTQMAERIYHVFQDILNLPLTTPEKMMAIQMLSPETLYIYPFGAPLCMLVSNEAILSKASRPWIEKLMKQEHAIEKLFVAELESAFDSGELQYEQAQKKEVIEELTVGHWAMGVGYLEVEYTRKARNLVGGDHQLPFPIQIDNPMIQAYLKLINGYSWKFPLTRNGLKKIHQLLEQHGNY